jgi:hypothetical protein
MPTCPNCTFTIDAKDTICPWCDNPVDAEYTPTKDSSGAVVAGSKRISALMRRYKDAYLVARAVNGYGSIIKVAGIIIGSLLMLVGLFLVFQRDNTSFALASGVMLLFFGIFVGVLFYLIGILISAQGQILKASLDGAVNTSPFLTDDNRARIMSLPEA